MADSSPTRVIKVKRFDPERPCAKCGHTATEDSLFWGRPTNDPYFETCLIRRSCSRCGNIWEELPLDFDEVCADWLEWAALNVGGNEPSRDAIAWLFHCGDHMQRQLAVEARERLELAEMKRKAECSPPKPEEPPLRAVREPGWLDWLPWRNRRG